MTFAHSQAHNARRTLTEIKKELNPVALFVREQRQYLNLKIPKKFAPFVLGKLLSNKAKMERIIGQSFLPNLMKNNFFRVVRE